MDTQLIAFREIDNFTVTDEPRRNLNITDINYQHAVKTNHGWFGGYALCKSSNGFVLFHAVQTQYLKTKWIQWMYVSYLNYLLRTLLWQNLRGVTAYYLAYKLFVVINLSQCRIKISCSNKLFGVLRKLILKNSNCAQE